MTAQDIFSIIFAVLTGVNVALLVYIHRRKANLDFRELLILTREGVNSFEKQTLQSLEDGLNRREEALAVKEKLFSLLLPEDQLERWKNALPDILAGVFQVPADILRRDLSKEEEAALERSFSLVFTESKQNGGGDNGVS